MLTTVSSFLLIESIIPVLSLRYEQYSISAATSGLLVLFSSIPFTLSSVLVVHLSRIISRRLVILLGGMLAIVSCLLTGPSHLFPFSKNFSLMLVGQMIGGCGFSFLSVPVLPEAQSVCFAKFQGRKREEIVNKLAGLFNTFFSIGHIFGPLIGGGLFESFGFRGLTDTLAVLTTGFFAAYFYFGEVYKWRKDGFAELEGVDGGNTGTQVKTDDNKPQLLHAPKVFRIESEEDESKDNNP